MKEPFEGTPLHPPSESWRTVVWRELTWTPGKGAPENMSLLRVLLNGIVVCLILAAAIFFLGLCAIALAWIVGLVF